MYPTTVRRGSRSKTFRLAGMIIMTVCLVCQCSGLASAHDERPGDSGRIPGLGDFERHGDTTYRFVPKKGEYEVTRPGQPPLFVHQDSIGGKEEGDISSFGETFFGSSDLPQNELAPICRTSGNRIVVVYSHPPGAYTIAPKEELRSIVRRMNWKIADQARLSSNGAREVRMATECDANGNISINEIVSPTEWEFISTAAPGQLFGRPQGGDAVKYLDFDGDPEPNGPAVAEGYLTSGEKSRENASARFTEVGMVGRAAWEDHATIHELFHTLGAVQYGDPPPPFSNGSGHCNDGTDVMCWSGRTEARCPADKYNFPTSFPIDCQYDTYFNTVPKPGTWLAEHWDVGGPEDPFLVSMPTEPPKAETGGATSIRPETVVLHGTVTPHADYAAFYFEYGPTPEYGHSAPKPRGVSGYGGSQTPVSSVLEGLSPESTYHYRVVAVNDKGEKSYGGDQVFATANYSATLCRVAEVNSLCARDNRYPSGTTLEAYSREIDFVFPTVSVSCTSTLKLQSSAATGEPLQLTSTSWAMEHCEDSSPSASCSPSVQGSLSATLYWGTGSPEEGGDSTGSLTLGGEGNESVRVSCSGSLELNCTYEVGGQFYIESQPGWKETRLASKGFVLRQPRGVCPEGGAELIPRETRLLAPQPLYVGYGASKPVAVTDPASAVDSTSATLKARVNAQDFDTDYHFEYDTAEYKAGGAAHGTKVPVPDKALGSGMSYLEVSQLLSGLKPGTRYHFRVVATNEFGVTYGEDQSFFTHQWSTQSTPNPEAKESSLEGVSCPSSTLCVAAGYDTYAEKSFAQVWNGSEWELAFKKLSNTSRAISCPSTTSCIAVGQAGSGSSSTAAAERWYYVGVFGVKWSNGALSLAQPAGGSEVRLNDVSCTSESACTAVGSYLKEGKTKTLAERYNGSTWSIQTTPNPESGSAQLLGVSCPSITSCKAVGKREGETFAESWNGSEWTIVSTPNPAGTERRLEKVSCNSASACMAVGSYTPSGEARKAFAESWNGSTWSVLTVPKPTAAKGAVELSSVSCPTSTSCYAVGKYVSSEGVPVEEKTLAETWNGTAWTVQSTPNPEGRTLNALKGVSCTPTSACTAVGSTAKSASDKVTLGERWE